jgi:tyrosyl-tRNA synthetase
LSGIIYPLVQTLDEEYLDVDVQYGGVDQRKIFVFARESLPKLGYRPRVEVMTPLIPGLVGKKMSASDPKSKIDLLDDPKTVEEKIGAAFCPEGVVEDNGLLVFTKYVIMVLKSDERKKFVIGRPQEFGGNLEFARYEELEKAFVEKKLHPLDLKKAVAKEINLLLAPFQKRRDELKKMAREAYPLSNS